MNIALETRSHVGVTDRWARNVVHERLGRLRSGAVCFSDPLGTALFGVKGAEPELNVAIHRVSAYSRIAADGSVGAGESYVDGDWDADDLVGVMRLLARESDTLSVVDGTGPRLSIATDFAKHLLRRNSVRGSRTNIAAHYDLGNDLFACFLDETMMYSAALFERDDASLHEASVAKLDRTCRKLGLGPEHHLLEIGTGWGGMALHAASRFGCRVTTTTVSQQQYELARERVARAGLEGRITVLLEDYRELAGRYDRLVSIEMIEAVGDAYLDGYFERCRSLLTADGLALIQSITVPDAAYDRSLRSVDFVKKHVFPGCQIPSLARLATAWSGTDFRLVNLEDLTHDYVLTLRHWRERFLANLDRVRALGYDERFCRYWEFYLAYCEAGFAERRTGDVQLLLARSANRTRGWYADLGRA